MVPFELGESVILNHVLLLSSKRGLVPFTDERVHNRAFSAKIRSIQEKIGIAHVKPIEFRISLPAISGLDLEDILDLRGVSSLRPLRESMRFLSTVVQNQPLSPLLWITISKHLDQIRRLGRQVLIQFKEALKSTRHALIVRVPAIFSIFVAISLVGTSFIPNNNLVSIFVDSKRLLPDITSIRNIPRMLRATIKGEPKKIKSGVADLRSFFSILKSEED